MVSAAALAHLIDGALIEPQGFAEDSQDSGPEVVITDVVEDSQQVTPGSLFAAIPGYRVHGASYAAQAIERGAVAIVTDDAGQALFGQVTIPVIVIEDVAERLGEIASLCHDRPADRLRSFGITGTNGKTTTTYMLEQILTHAGCKTALIGGVELRIGGVHTSTSITTPLPADLQRMLAQHVAAGGTDAVMEVTSHALLQHRTDPIRFAVAGFTHLSVDHLDFHPNIENYFEAKSRLFVPERCESAVILVDDEWGRTLFAEAKTRLSCVYALAVTSELPEGADGWQVEASTADLGHFTLRGTDGSLAEYECGLPGIYNISNAALALTMALTGGVSADDLPRSVTPHVPGRMEVISEHSPRVIVDFAHNADALANALIALRPTTDGRLIVVTGTAGDRDATKRFDMGRACALHADVVVITDDDPHTEDPQQIRDALIEGTVGCDVEVIEIADRTTAMHHAVTMAKPDDTVMIAGRGHWTVQFVGHDLVELDDREVAREALTQRTTAHQGINE